VAIDGLAGMREGARLRWFIVSPVHQGRGLGGRLMEEALAFCRKAGYPRIQLSTFAGLAAARHLYEKHGFTLRREEESARWGLPVMEQTFILDF
jgi:GNAT superfamily N-acetyltransferase